MGRGIRARKEETAPYFPTLIFGNMNLEAEMKTLRKIMLILKIGFLSIFGTTRGLANVEQDMAFIADHELEKDSGENLTTQ